MFEVDVASHEVVRELDTGSSWSKVMAFSPDERTLYVENWSGHDVSEIDLPSGRLRRGFPAVDTPRELYVTPDDSRLFVAAALRDDMASDEIFVVDVATESARKLADTDHMNTIDLTSDGRVRSRRVARRPPARVLGRRFTFQAGLVARRGGLGQADELCRVTHSRNIGLIAVVTCL